MTRLIALSLFAAAASVPLTGCGITSEATTLPFDLASTTGDAATSASSSGGDDDQASLRTQHYVKTQIDWIERDAASGEGEHIKTLAVLLGESDTDGFARWAQQHHARLFADLDAPEQLIARIDALR